MHKFLCTRKVRIESVIGSDKIVTATLQIGETYPGGQSFDLYGSEDEMSVYVPGKVYTLTEVTNHE